VIISLVVQKLMKEIQSYMQHKKKTKKKLEVSDFHNGHLHSVKIK